MADPDMSNIPSKEEIEKLKKYLIENYPVYYEYFKEKKIYLG